MHVLNACQIGFMSQPFSRFISFLSFFPDGSIAFMKIASFNLLLCQCLSFSTIQASLHLILCCLNNFVCWKRPFVVFLSRISFLCWLNLSFSIRPVSPIYTASHFSHPIRYITPFWSCISDGGFACTHKIFTYPIRIEFKYSWYTASTIL